MKKLSVLFIAGVLAVSLAGCGSSSHASASYDGGGYGAAAAEEASYAGDYDYAMPMEEEAVEDLEYEGNTSAAKASAGENTAADQKIVYTCDMQVETLEYKDTVGKIRELINGAGGIISYENESDSNYQWYYSDAGSGVMSLYLTVMIPAENYQQFVADVSETGKVLSKSMNAENITKNYGDTKALVESYQTELARLQTFMEKAETIEDMMAVEERISEVESELNRYKSELSLMDTNVQYSTVNLNVKEVKEYSPEVLPDKTFGERMKEAFGDSWVVFGNFLETMLTVIIYLLPFIIMLAVIVIIILAIVFSVRKKHRNDPERQAKKEKKRLGKKDKKAKGGNVMPLMPATEGEETAVPGTGETADVTNEEN